jgi:hypothetical protein
VSEKPMFKIAQLGDDPIISAVTSGFWSIEIADRYLNELAAAARLARKRFGFVHVMVDARKSAVHGIETVTRLHSVNRIVSHAPDRIAIVAATALEKQQIVRGLPGNRGEAFLSIWPKRGWPTSAC